MKEKLEALKKKQMEPTKEEQVEPIETETLLPKEEPAPLPVIAKIEEKPEVVEKEASAEIPCPSCGKPTPRKGNFCGWCGFNLVEYFQTKLDLSKMGEASGLEQKQEAIEKAKDFLELFKVLDNFGSVLGSDGESTISSEQLKDQIRKVFTGEFLIENITKTYDLQETVKRLVNERAVTL